MAAKKTAIAGFTILTLLISIVLLSPGLSKAALIFEDDFDTGASGSWENNCGSWEASSGVYYSTDPNNYPNAHSALPFNLQDFVIELDINGVSDGGVWLRSNETGAGLGIQGILLVTLSNYLYWHIVTGTDYGPIYGWADHSSGKPHLRITVIGNIYSVYLNGEETPRTTLDDANFSDGRIALYSNSSQTFDNVQLFDSTPIPAPSTLLLLGSGLVGLVRLRRKFKK